MSGCGVAGATPAILAHSKLVCVYVCVQANVVKLACTRVSVVGDERKRGAFPRYFSFSSLFFARSSPTTETLEQAIPKLLQQQIIRVLNIQD